MARRGIIAFVLLLLWPAAAHATSVTVTTTNDGDDGACTPSVCTLRDAVKYSNADTIVLPGRVAHYKVIASAIQVSRPVTIQGAGASASVIDATAPGQHRAFELTGFIGPANASVTFRGVTITGAHTTDAPGGAGIYVAPGAPSLRLERSVVSGNRADLSIPSGANGQNGGGGIYDASTRSLTLVGTRVSGNTVTVQLGGIACCNGGGGVYVSDGKLTIRGGSHVDGNDVTVNGPTAPAGGSSGGGGVFENSAAAPTAIKGSTVSQNTVTVTEGACCHGGGGVYLNSDAAAPDTLTNAHVDGNTATVNGPSSGSVSGSGGGGIYTDQALRVVGGTANGNSAKVTAGNCCHGGGAVNAFVDDQAVSFRRVTMRDNVSTVDGDGCCSGGGAIDFDAGAGSLSLRASTLFLNRSKILGGATASGGGAVYQDSGPGATLRYVNDTLSSNRTNAAGLTRGGGAIFAIDDPDTPVQLANVTIAGNAATAGAGGGVLNFGSTVVARNSIVALNVASTGNNCAAVTGEGPAKYTSGGFNLENGKTCHFTATGDRTPSGSIGLAPLADNGGPTATRGILSSSPAFNGGNPAGCRDFAGALIGVDQRGARRPFGPRCDIGAFELHPPHLRRLKVTPSKFTVPPGATLSYVDDQPSNTTVTVLRCRRKNGKRVCDHHVGQFVWYDAIGPNKIHLAKVQGQKLGPGRYRLRAVARLYGLASRPATASFRVVG